MLKQPAMDDMITFIRECANIEGTELGETWSLLLNLYHHRSCISNTTTKSLEKEIKSVYQYLKKETKIEERTINTPRTIRELVFLNE